MRSRLLAALAVVAALAGSACITDESNPAVLDAEQVLDSVRPPAGFDEVARLTDGVGRFAVYVGSADTEDATERFGFPEGWRRSGDGASLGPVWDELATWEGPHVRLEGLECFAALRVAEDPRLSAEAYAVDDEQVLARIDRGELGVYRLGAGCDDTPA